jgi:hypothetical protein
MSPAKKKPGRQAHGRTDSGASSRKKAKGADLEIHLVTEVGADPSWPTAKKNKAAGAPDRVRWINETDRGRTLTFTKWPFVEPPAPIAIAAGKKSPWYTLYPEITNGPYDYHIEPAIVSSSGPPGDPGMLVED